LHGARKAWRWVGKMDQIAATFLLIWPARRSHESAAQIFALVPREAS
jgi:hypothetical protein